MIHKNLLKRELMNINHNLIIMKYKILILSIYTIININQIKIITLIKLRE